MLHRINLGEHDRILTLYTLDRGKLNVVAKGSRKPVSKLAGATELFTHSRLQLAVGRNLDVVTQAEITDPFHRIRSDLARIAHASLMAELVDRFTEERDPHPEILDLTVDCLRALEHTHDPDLVTHLFQLHLLAGLGYCPHLAGCVACHDPSGAQPVAFCAALGGAVCAAHRRGRTDAFGVRPETLALARAFLGIAPSNGEALALLSSHAGPDVRRELDRVIRSHILFHLQRPLRSLDFIEEVRAMDAAANQAGGQGSGGQTPAQ